MKLVLDLQGAQSASRFRGIGRYSTALAQAIARNAGGHEVWIALNYTLNADTSAVCAAFADVVPAERIVTFHVPRQSAGCNATDGWRRSAAELAREAFLAELEPDVIHVSSIVEGSAEPAVTSIGMFDATTPTAATLYDLIPLLRPEIYLPNEMTRAWYRQKFDSLRRADVLLAISEFARDEGIEAGLDASKIVNVSAACADWFRPVQIPASERKSRLAAMGIAGPYVLYSGAFDIRKNIDRLIEAFARLPAAVREAHLLVLAGPIVDGERQNLLSQAKRLGVDSRLRVLGHVSDADLLLLLGCCRAFVFPSLHEGFGLPPLEAMSCGVPTIGANATSIPEVIGRTDALFDPDSADDIARLLNRVLTDERYAAELREHGLARARLFSWDASARRAWQAFEQVAERSRQGRNAPWQARHAARERNYRGLLARVAKIRDGKSAPAAGDLEELATCIGWNRQVSDRVRRTSRLPDSIAWRIEGPFDSSYSLALLNRETARALARLGHHVVLHSTEGPGDFQPDAGFLGANPDLALLNERAATEAMTQVAVTSRNLYPPRVSDMASPVNLLHHYAWEESGLPAQWVEDFNRSLQGITCLSSHVRKVLIDNGVTTPLAVSGCGVDHWERVTATSCDFAAKSFRFLHVSSCFPRKGVEVLLEAYGKAFRDSDDVSLVIKTFANPHNEVRRLLADARELDAGFPDVVLIEDDLPEDQLKALYRECHVLVAPSCAEGFGLPLAEAMLSGLPVITTGWGGQLDFCDASTAWLIDYDFAAARTHFDLFNSVWALPRVDHLVELLRVARACPDAGRREKAERGRARLLDQFRWAHVAQRLVDFARDTASAKSERELRVGWVSTWNTRCGIAEYSRSFIDRFPEPVVMLAARTDAPTRPDDVAVVRCWDQSDDEYLEEVADAAARHGIRQLVVQFNYGFFNFEALGEFLAGQLDAGRILVVELHATKDPEGQPDRELRKLLPALRRCHRLLAHSVNDLNRLKALGLVDNVQLFPHGIVDSHFMMGQIEGPGAEADRHPLLATFGFFLPDKGLLEMIEAVALLRQAGIPVRLRMLNAEYPIALSAEVIAQARALIDRLALGDCIELHTEYLDNDDVMARLAEADLIVYPYQRTGESASGAVRQALATGKPVAVSPLPIFDEIESIVHRLPGTSPRDICDGVRGLLEEISAGSEGVRLRREALVRWKNAHSFSRLALQLHGTLTALSRER